MRLFLAAVAVVALCSCGKHLYTRDDLDVSLFQHHNNLRWGRLENASLTVTPEMRSAFLNLWAARMQRLELQDMEVAGVVMAKDGESADVVVSVSWIDKSSMTMQQSSMNEHWIRTDDGWQVEKPGEL
jgi:hypothetical protein